MILTKSNRLSIEPRRKRYTTLCVAQTLDDSDDILRYDKLPFMDISTVFSELS